MTSIESALVEINRALIDLRVPFALVGGLAVSVRTEPRFTRDADLAVAVASDAQAEALIHALGQRGFRASTVIEQEAVGRLATVRLALSDETQAPVVDLLFASSGIETEIVAESEPIELVPRLTMGVARIGHLIAMKVLSRDDLRRPQDIADLRSLLRVASSDELASARLALALISTRGYSRGRDLAAGLNGLFPPHA